MEFVKKEIGISANDINEYFYSEIDKAAADCNIDWSNTKNKIKEGRNSGIQVVGIEKADKGRVYIWLEYKKTKVINGSSFEYAEITFKNYRNGLGKPGIQFNALSFIFKEYEKFK